MSFSTMELRSTYRRSGRVDLARFVPWVLLTLLVGVAMAICLFLAFDGGFYYFIVVPAIASLPVAGAAYLAVGGGHCRNRAIAGALGLLAAAVVYLGYFHVHFVREARPFLGNAAIFRVDYLPDFIAFRMKTDVVVDEGGRKQAAQGGWFNWVWFALDFLIVIGLVGAAAVGRTGRVYCEGCRSWARRLVAHLPPGTARAVASALGSGGLEGLPEVPADAVKPQPSSAQVTLEYCRERPDRFSSCPVYLTAKEIVVKKGGIAGPSVKGSTALLKQVEITPEEMQALCGKIAALRPAGMGAQRPSTAGSPAAPGVVERPASPYVEPLPAESAREVFRTRNKVLAGLLSLMPLVLAVGGLVMVGVGLWRQPWTVGAGGGAGVVAWLLIAAGLLAAGFGVVVCWNNVDFFNFRFGYRVTRRALEFRPSAVVNADDPDAVYVEIVPREHWSGVFSDRPSDAGFLKVDTRSRQLLFEGVCQRYRIPGEALCWCEVEPINPQGGRFTTFVTVIRTRDPHAPPDVDAGHSDLSLWEAPLLPRPVRFGKYGPVQRRGLPDELRDRIRMIMSAGERAPG